MTAQEKKQTKEQILDGFAFRHACKAFDEDKKISEEDFDFIMQTARLSPSSFGMEHWRFLVTTDEKTKARIRPHCWGQSQITTASHTVIVLAKVADVTDDKYIDAMFSRRKLDKDATQGYIQKYKKYVTDLVHTFVARYFYKNYTKDRPIYEWSARQTYIAAANMTTSAAMIGIDSCFIEGFKKEALEKELDIDTTKEQIAVVLTFGYRKNAQPPKHRLSMSEITQTIP